MDLNPKSGCFSTQLAALVCFSLASRTRGGKRIGLFPLRIRSNIRLILDDLFNPPHLQVVQFAILMPQIDRNLRAEALAPNVCHAAVPNHSPESRSQVTGPDRSVSLYLSHAKLLSQSFMGMSQTYTTKKKPQQVVYVFPFTRARHFGVTLPTNLQPLTS